MTRLCTMACALVLLLVTACGDDEKMQEIGEKAAATWKAVAAYTVEKKDEALAFFGKQMEALEGQWAKAKEASAEWSGEARAALEAKWQAVQEAYARTKSATGESWAKARDAFRAAYDAFEAELDR